MNPCAEWLRKRIGTTGQIFLIPVGLIIVVLLAVLSRPLFIITAVLAVLGVGLCGLSPRFRRWIDGKLDEQTYYKGLRFVSGVALHPTHSWARIFAKRVTVGADDMVQAVLGPVEQVNLPPVGQRVEEGDRLFHLRRGDRSVDVRAPISGTVVSRNETLLRRPRLVNDEPFHRGWAVRLRPDNVAEARRHLFHGQEARVFLGHEIDRLVTSLHAAEEASEVVLADGGAVVGDLYRHIDDGAWERVTENFFVPRGQHVSGT